MVALVRVVAGFLVLMVKAGLLERLVSVTRPGFDDRH